MPITSYTQDPGVSYAGMLADLSLRDDISRRNSDSLTIPVGVAVVQDPTAADGCLLPRDATHAFLGVQYKLDRVPSLLTGGTTDAQVNQMVGIMRRGRIWVKSEDAVLLADIGKQGHVRVRCAASAGNTQLGAFRNSTDATPASTFFLNGAVFLTPCGAGGLTVVEIPDAVTLTLGS